MTHFDHFFLSLLIAEYSNLFTNQLFVFINFTALKFKMK